MGELPYGFPKYIHILHFHQQCIRDPISQYPYQPHLAVLIITIDIPVVVKCCSLILYLSSNIKHLCVFLGHLYSFYGEVSIPFLCPLLNYFTYFVLLLWSIKNSKSLPPPTPDMVIANIFFHSLNFLSLSWRYVFFLETRSHVAHVASDLLM